MSALSKSSLLYETCNNPACTEEILPGSGVRIILHGMELAFCNHACARARLKQTLDDARYLVTCLKQIEERGHALC